MRIVAWRCAGWIEKGDISSDDQDALREFDNQLTLLGSQYGKQRREKPVRHCVRIAENVGGLAAALEDRDAAVDIVRWIHDTYDNEESNRVRGRGQDRDLDVDVI